MKFIIEKRNYIILFLIIILCFWIISIKNNRVFLKSFYFNGKTITINIYDKVNINKVSKKIKSIYKKYENLKKIKEYDISVEDDNYDSILLSYATENVIKYFKNYKIKKYIINEAGNIITGKKYGDNKYSISVNNPNNDEILEIVSLENECMVTVNNGDYDSLVVIGYDIVKTNIFAQEIKTLSIEDGKENALKNSYAVLWYDGKNILMTDNFKKYII